MQNRYISARHPTLIGPAAEFDIVLEWGDMDTEKVREIVRNYISERPRNTAEIAAWLNRHDDGTGGSDVAAILESDGSFVRIGTVRTSGMTGNSPPLSEWATEKWVQHHERAKPDKK